MRGAPLGTPWVVLTTIPMSSDDPTPQDQPAPTAVVSYVYPVRSLLTGIQPAQPSKTSSGM